MKTKDLGTACPKKVGEKSLYLKRIDRDKAFKAKDLHPPTRQSKGGFSMERDSRKVKRIKLLEATVAKAHEQIFGEGVLPPANPIDFNKLTSFDVYQLDVLIRNIIG